MIEERTEICNSCTYWKEKCTFCSCAGKGIIEEPTSRCPINIWPDGWGDQPILEKQVDEIKEPLYFDEETNTSMTAKEIEELYNSAYVFPTEEESWRIIRLKNMLYLAQ